MLFLIDIPLLGLTFTDLVAWIVAIFVGVAGLIKAIREITELGFRPAAKKFVDWITRRRSRRKKLDELIDKFGAMDTKIDRIDCELRTNGGSTVKDMVCRIDEKVEHIQARVRHQDETSDKPIFELDSRGHLTFANCAFRELVNADDQDLTHRSYLSKVHADDRTRFIRELDEAIENKMPIDSTVKMRYDSAQFVTVRLCANPDVRSVNPKKEAELIGFFGTAAKA